MKRYIYYLILIPIFSFGNPGIGDKRKTSFFDLETLGNYPDYSINLERTDFVSTIGGASGTLSVVNNVLSLNFSGGWNQSAMKTGVIKVLTISPGLPDLELGPILTSSSGSANGYNVKIENNSLVIYSTGGTLPLTTGAYFSIRQDLNEGSAIFIPNDNLNNWVHGVSYDSKGNVISQSRSYFDDLGKGDVNLSKDYVTNKIWGTETTFDNFGRPDKTSFIAPSPLDTFDKVNFFKSNSQAQGEAYPTILPLNNISISKDYKASESISVVGAVSPGLTVSLTAPRITLGDTFTIKATSGSSFKITAAILPDVSANPSLANYYSDTNTEEPYQATATHPFTQNNYDTLNPGNVINVTGGNRINGEWRTGYAYTVPAAQEMYYVYGSDYFDGPVTSGKEEVITKFYKSVSIDANGNENVAFTDGEGKLLASARSGGGTSYPVISLIGTQGFVDVHIPAGTSGISLIGGPSFYKVYDLKTGSITTSLASGNAYRIEAVTPPLVDPKIYITAGKPEYVGTVLGITYNVNYYDYAVNVYNKTGQLIKSIQPNGYIANTTIVGTPAHMTSTNFASTYKYDTLGQLTEVSSPDEGISQFAYRQDGQIRYSQSALQSDTKVSYTDYDTLGRPQESGVIANNWSTANANPDGALISGVRTEQTFTIYDDAENNLTSVAIPATLSLSSVLTTAGITTTNYVQNNLSGNVAVTFTKPGSSITAITWYSYDVYGRTEWIVQYNEGIGAKTIHYEYNHQGGVKKVLYQKDKAAELFVHQYTYDINGVLTKVETSIDNSPFITHAEYTYYKTGELKRVNIAQGTQGLDYVYTLGGQLKSINHPSLEETKDPGGDKNDVFGLTLDYYGGDYLRTGRNITTSPTVGADYNGNIKAARWANKGVPGDYSGTSANQKGYLYNYNRNNWLTEATFGNANSTTAVISPAANLTLGERGLSYDANGNIKTLVRTNESGTVTDNLTYKYTNTGKNQLNSVSDAVTTTDATDIENQAPGNYQYDAIGQLIRNNAEDTDYTYNTQGLVTQVKKGTQLTVTFSYNERGQRVKKQTIAYLGSGNTRTETNYYIPDLSGSTMSVYYSLSGTLIKPPIALYQKEIPIFGLSRLGIYTKGTNKESDIISYEITDHLGNVRAVISKENDLPAIKSYADYYPFGEQLPGRNAFSDYRYAFQGQELDKETGMEAFQLRLWDGRIGRWLSPDPYGQYSSPYLGMGNNPIGMIDPDGGWGGWLTAFGHWVAGGFEGKLHKSSEYGDWGINKASNNTVYTTEDGGLGIKGNTDYGGKRYNNNAVSFSDVASNVWNSNFIRSKINDQYNISFGYGGGGIGPGAGASFTAHWLTRGPDASFIPYVNFLPDVDVNIGIGAAAAADLSFGASSFRGKVSDITAAGLIGPSRYVSVTAADIIGGTAEYSQSFNEKNEVSWDNVSYGITGGAGIRVQAGVKYTMVLIHPSGIYGIKRDGGWASGYHLGNFSSN